MPIEIGRRPANYHESPIQLMSDCHRRIERFLYVLITIKRQAQGGALLQDQKAALDSALRYFRDAAPLHTLDEEESLFPRMRLAARPGFEVGHHNLEGLELEHALIQVCHRELDQLGRKWIEHNILDASDSQEFAEIVRKLSIVYHRHIRQEETEVYPAALKMLRDPEIRAIGQEMMARREVSFVHEMIAAN